MERPTPGDHDPAGHGYSLSRKNFIQQGVSMLTSRRMLWRVAVFTKKKFQPIPCLSVMALGFVRAAAAPVVLFNGNSSITLDPTSPAGISDWIVDGQDLLHQQWFSFGIGSGAMSSIETIGTPTILRPNDGTIQLTYANSQFS